MRVLVAFGSKRGGSAGLADMIGGALREAGCETVVSPAAAIYDLAEFDAVIVVGALYTARWHRNARRFVRRHMTALRAMPVWLVSSGPLDDSAERGDIPSTKQVAKLARRIGARGHVTFGGCLSAHATGFPASRLAKTRAGDWRNEDHVKRWVQSLIASFESRQDSQP